jgi:hypothetical protein
MSVAFTAVLAASGVSGQSFTVEERDLRSKQTEMWRPYEIFNRLLIKNIKTDDVVQDFYPPQEADDGYTKAISSSKRDILRMMIHMPSSLKLPLRVKQLNWKASKRLPYSLRTA